MPSCCHSYQCCVIMLQLDIALSISAASCHVSSHCQSVQHGAMCHYTANLCSYVSPQCPSVCSILPSQCRSVQHCAVTHLNSICAAFRHQSISLCSIVSPDCPSLQHCVISVSLLAELCLHSAIPCFCCQTQSIRAVLCHHAATLRSINMSSLLPCVITRAAWYHVSSHYIA